MSKEQQSVLGGFKEFLMRGNVVELAVAVVIGAAFTNIVNSVVEGVINPVVGAFGTQDLDLYQSCLKGPCETNAAGEIVSGIPIRWGTVVSAGLTFLITAAVVYFLMIMPLTRYKARMEARRPKDTTPPPKTELDLLVEIRDELIAQRRAAENGTVAIGAQRSPAPDGGSGPDGGDSPGAGKRLGD
ncbi:large conductance mechanosensitive channel protein MscL [Streptomyces alkaliphilus]|uniref:large conductance mechanosensitive channel protein MscL n=1 Tax=Streptomyces alkaliphilus TaxID=1472722 RepID=UPI0011805C10|nr:large conductance mechanosensitive channel protein MscL [Streptomyces alkaliphilus]MQS09059.1 large conductance mechanosensitive channel protein MscL [Streptomyces alkaliphilus]